MLILILKLLQFFRYFGILLFHNVLFLLVKRLRKFEYLGNLPNQLVADHRKRIIVIFFEVERCYLLVYQIEALNQFLEATSSLLLNCAALNNFHLLAKTSFDSINDLFIEENRRIHLLHLTLKLLDLRKIP